MKKSGLVLFFLVLYAGTAFADGVASHSSVSARVSRSGFSDDLRWLSVKYYGVYYGAAVNDVGGGVHDSYGRATPTDQYFLNYTGIGYKITPDLIPGITVMSTYTPARGKGFALLDPCFRVTETHLLKRGGWDVYDELRYYLPATDDSKKAHKDGSFAIFQIVTYSFPGSRWSAGAWMKLCWTRYGDEVVRGTNLQAYLKPELFYQISPTVSASLYYEMNGAHSLRKSYMNWVSAGTDLQPGLVLTLAPGLVLNPYVQISTGGKISADSTAIGAQIFATII